MTPRIPLEIAQSAKEKLQASAQEIWSSIRSFDDVNKKPSKDGSAGPDNGEGAATMSLEKISSVLGVMFGSCTTGMPHKAPGLDEPTQTLDQPAKRQRSREFVSTKDIGEQVYAQLFVDDQERASRAVEGLRVKAALSPNGRSPSKTNLEPTCSPPNPAGQKTPDMPPTTTAVDVSDDFSFDDGISAISSHTLEEMAKVYDHKASISQQHKTKHFRRANNVQKISYPTSSRPQRSPKSPSKFPPLPSIMAPLKFSRGQSHGTHASKATKSSKGTKSTNSTQDSEFASVWRKEERKYWDDVVEEDKKNSTTHGTRKLSSKSRRRSKCGSHAVSSNTSLSMFWSAQGSFLFTHLH